MTTTFINTYILWTPKFETGIKLIDEQHKQIIVYINALQRIVDSNDKAVVIEIIAALDDYIVSHFEYEENLMLQSHYTQSDTHKMGHDIFRHHIGAYRDRAEKGRDVAHSLLKFLRSWLLGHILKDDMAYVAVVKRVEQTQRSRGFVANLKRVLARA